MNTKPRANTSINSQIGNSSHVADYSRQLRVWGMDAAAQKKLQKSSVLVVGAGGLGVTAMSYLAAAGVGAMTVLDHDTIEASNLHRQTIYTYADLGKSKAETAVAYLQARTVDCTLTAVVAKARLQNMTQLVTQHDVVLDCTDDFTISYLINDLAWHTRTPAVFANAAGMQGQLFVLNPTAPNAPETQACWRCMWPEPPTNAGNNTCDAVGVLGPVPAILGCMQAIEAIKLITAFQPAMHNQLLNQHFGTHQLHTIKVQPRTTCQHKINTPLLEQRHGEQRHFTNNLAQAIEQGYAVVDIRSTDEVAQQPYAETTLHIPMQDLLTAPQQYLSADQRYVLACSTGRRSRNVVTQLQSNYPNLFYYP